MFDNDFGFRDRLERFRDFNSEPERFELPEPPRYLPSLSMGQIRDSNSRVIGSVDSFGNITDSLGSPTMLKVDGFGNIQGPGVPLGTRVTPSLGGSQVQDIGGRTLNALPEPFRPFGS
jgi:hypothetical protein